MNENKKVAVVGTVGLPANYGGFETLVENLTDSQNFNYVVYCSSKHYPDKIKCYKGSKLIYLPLSANGKSSILYDIFSLIHAVFIERAESVLILGVSGTLILPFLKTTNKVKIITNIDGLEWKRDKWGRLAKSFLKMSEALAVKYSDVVITDNQAIADYVEEEYKSKSVVIAYGGDHALLTTAENVQHDDDTFYLTICRIEPENNIHIILDAFTQSVERIKFIGNWNASEYGRNLLKNYSDFSNIELINPVYDIDELYKLRTQCKGYVHGHSAGGTNPSLVEAMHFGKPVYAFDCTFNRYTTEDQAFFFANSKALLEFLNDSVLDTDTNAVSMKEIAQRRYTWKKITQQYEALY